MTGKDRGGSKTRYTAREKTHQWCAALQERVRKVCLQWEACFKWHCLLDTTISYGYTRSIPPLWKTVWPKGRGEARVLCRTQQRVHSLHSEHRLTLQEASLPALWALQKGRGAIAQHLPGSSQQLLLSLMLPLWSRKTSCISSNPLALQLPSRHRNAKRNTVNWKSRACSAELVQTLQCLGFHCPRHASSF